MDLMRLGSAFVDMELSSWRLALDGTLRFNRAYYEQQEQVFQRWVSEIRAAGVVSPVGLLIATGWLVGYAMAHWARPFRRVEVLATLLWLYGLLKASGRTHDDML